MIKQAFIDGFNYACQKNSVDPVKLAGFTAKDWSDAFASSSDDIVKPEEIKSLYNWSTTKAGPAIANAAKGVGRFARRAASTFGNALAWPVSSAAQAAGRASVRIPKVQPGERAVVDSTGRIVGRNEIATGTKPLFTGAQYNASKSGQIPYSLSSLASMKGHDEWQKRLASKVKPKTQLVAKK